MAPNDLLMRIAPAVGSEPQHLCFLGGELFLREGSRKRPRWLPDAPVRTGASEPSPALTRSIGWAVRDSNP